MGVYILFLLNELVNFFVQRKTELRKYNIENTFLPYKQGQNVHRSDVIDRKTNKQEEKEDSSGNTPIIP